MLSYAKEWFLIAKEKDTEIEKVSFGLALVLVKQLNFTAALREIDELIQRLEKGNYPNHKIDMTYYYIRALCYKKLELFDKAKTDYEYFVLNLGLLLSTQSHRTITVCPISFSRLFLPKVEDINRNLIVFPT